MLEPIQTCCHMPQLASRIDSSQVTLVGVLSTKADKGRTQDSGPVSGSCTNRFPGTTGVTTKLIIQKSSCITNGRLVGEKPHNQGLTEETTPPQGD